MAGSSFLRIPVLVLGAWLAWAAPAMPQGADEPSGTWFTAERLNAGLDMAPAELDRSTPMGTMESFVDAIRTGRYWLAAHLLDLSRVPVEQQSERGPELARKLGVILENHLWIDWDELPDQPDATVEAGNDAMAGQARRSVLLGHLDIGSHSVPLRLSRVKAADGDPAWLFSRQTVGNIDELHRIYGPGWLRDRLPPEWRRSTWLSLQRWELVAFPLLIAAALLVFLALRVLFNALARAAPWHSASRAVREARTPLALLTVAGLLQYATATVVTFSAPITAILTPVLITAMVVAVTLALLRAIDALIDMVEDRYVGKIGQEEPDDKRHLYTSFYAARRIVLLIAVVGGLGVVLSQLRLFESLGISLLASAGVLTVILGIAAQPVLGNILASLQIALAKPIRIGDSVQYEGNWAYVESIFYTFVRLRTWDDRRLVVPVQYFISHPFENWSMVEEKMTRVFVLTLDPRADVAELREAYLELARADEDVMPDEMLKVLVVDQDHNGMAVRFYSTAKDASTAWDMHCRLREQTLAWIREKHPEWWPRQRELQETHDKRDEVRLDAAE